MPVNMNTKNYDSEWYRRGEMTLNVKTRKDGDSKSNKTQLYKRDSKVNKTQLNLTKQWPINMGAIPTQTEHKKW